MSHEHPPGQAAGSGAEGDVVAALERFVAAQQGTFEVACREIAAGRKESHWIWFVMPQMRGLRRSPLAHHFGIASLEEARAYLGHPVLGMRLRRIAALLLGIEGLTIGEIMGTPDDLKVRSSLTLFARAAEASGEDAAVFRDVLARYFAGKEDAATLDLLGLGA